MSARPPILLVQVELEQLPVSVVLATATAEDEQLLRVRLSSAAGRRHVLQAVEKALDELARKQAA